MLEMSRSTTALRRAHRRRARHADAARRRSGEAARRRRGGVQRPRRRRAAGARQALAKETDPRVKRALNRRAPRSCSISRRTDADRVAADRHVASARRPGRARHAARQSAEGGRRRSKTAAASGRRPQSTRAGALGQRAERLVRAVARLGAAARRHRARHHLRRHGRHQHGARRNGDARRLYDLRGAGGRSGPARRRCSTGRCPSPCRWPSWSPARVGVVIERGIIRFLYGRPLETLLATLGVSLVLQQAVRTMFGPTNREVGAPSCMAGAFELGGLPSPTAGCGSSCSRSLFSRRCLRAAQAHAARPADARGHPEPPHGAAMGIRTPGWTR